MELHGCTLLRLRDLRGIVWLVRSQLCLLSVILLYVAWSFISFNLDQAKQHLTPDLAAALKEAGLSVDEVLNLLQTAFRLTYATVGIVAVFYQGGLARYYHRRREMIERALQ
jgi:hypothetical protein